MRVVFRPVLKLSKNHNMTRLPVRANYIRHHVPCKLRKYDKDPENELVWREDVKDKCRPVEEEQEGLQCFVTIVEGGRRCKAKLKILSSTKMVFASESYVDSNNTN